MKKVYLDHNATTPIHPEVLQAMLPLLEEGGFGNPSSPHWAGQAVAGVLEEARRHAAALIGAKPSEIVFTSGGSEGDNMAIKCLLMAGKKGHIVTSTIEHPAVYKTCKAMEALGYEVSYVGVDGYGMVTPDAVEAAMRKDTLLVSIMYANNETGTINPISEISAIAKKHGALMHTDAVQAVGKLPLNVGELGVDMLTASGHKFNAPKGVGFQFVREGLEAAPFITGGGQEGGLRAGTENMAGIAALGKACEVALRTMDEKVSHIGALRQRLEKGIMEGIKQVQLNGHPEKRIYNTLNISVIGVESESIQGMLNMKGIACSTGSACASGSGEPSRALVSMGLDALCSRGALRLSLGYGNTEEDIDYCLDVLVPLANRLLEMSPFYKG